MTNWTVTLPGETVTANLGEVLAAKNAQLREDYAKEQAERTKSNAPHDEVVDWDAVLSAIGDAEKAATGPTAKPDDVADAMRRVASLVSDAPRPPNEHDVNPIWFGFDLKVKMLSEAKYMLWRGRFAGAEVAAAIGDVRRDGETYAEFVIREQNSKALGVAAYLEACTGLIEECLESVAIDGTTHTDDALARLIAAEVVQVVCVAIRAIHELPKKKVSSFGAPHSSTSQTLNGIAPDAQPTRESAADASPTAKKNGLSVSTANRNGAPSGPLLTAQASEKSGAFTTGQKET